MEINATVKHVLFGVKSHKIPFYYSLDCQSYPIAVSLEEEALMSIKDNAADSNSSAVD